MNDDEVDVDRYTREHRYGPAVDPPGTAESKKLSELAEIENKEEQDFTLIREILDDMLYSYSHRYQDKKDKMIINMTQIAKQLGDLNIKRLMAHCVIFPTILKEFNEILSNELEQRRNNKNK
ncbi:MAG: hypothetical protein ACAH23_00200 [Nitrososphaeraceae archaeon]